MFNSMTRRDLLKRSAAVGLAAGLGPLSLGAARAAEPKRGGHLKLALDGGSTARGLDPATYAQSFDAISGLQMYNTLTELNDAGLPEGALVTELASDDLVTWVLKVRPDVTFHNGKTLEPADIIYSLNHHRGPDSKSAARSLLAAVEDITASAPGEVTIKLEAANADLPAILSDYHFCIAPEGADFEKGIGTGAFILEDHQPGTRTLTRRNPDFWRSDRGFVDSVETIAINDANARISALRTGAVHMMNRVDAKVATLLQSDTTLDLHATPGSGFYTIALRCDEGIFSNPDLRLALKYSLDREAMVRIALNGFGTVGNDQPIASLSPFYADIPQRAYDPDKVKYHLQKSGFSGTIPILCPAHQTNVLDAGQVLQQRAVEAGLPVEFQRVPTDGYMENIFKKAPAFTVYWNGRATPDMMFSQAFKSDAPWNASTWQSADFDALLLAARGERDQARRKEMYADMQRMVHEDGGEAVWTFFTVLDATSKTVGGYTPTFYAELSGQRAPEKVWLEG